MSNLKAAQAKANVGTHPLLLLRSEHTQEPDTEADNAPERASLVTREATASRRQLRKWWGRTDRADTTRYAYPPSMTHASLADTRSENASMSTNRSRNQVRRGCQSSYGCELHSELRALDSGANANEWTYGCFLHVSEHGIVGECCTLRQCCSRHVD